VSQAAPSSIDVATIIDSQDAPPLGTLGWKVTIDADGEITVAPLDHMPVPSRTDDGC
jgi:hypothetical protein